MLAHAGAEMQYPTMFKSFGHGKADTPFLVATEFVGAADADCQAGRDGNGNFQIKIMLIEMVQAIPQMAHQDGLISIRKIETQKCIGTRTEGSDAVPQSSLFRHVFPPGLLDRAVRNIFGRHRFFAYAINRVTKDV